jgi:hypothetical protein
MGKNVREVVSRSVTITGCSSKCQRLHTGPMTVSGIKGLTTVASASATCLTPGCGGTVHLSWSGVL